jgi:tetratricopeptide (TPR) repeat protein
MVNQRKSVEYLFEQALALRQGERAAFLDEACSSSPELRDSVERLLAQDAEAGSFLNAPLFSRPDPAGSLDEATAEACMQSSETAERSGHKSTGRFKDNDVLTGRFRIVRFIDSGGMGEVYEVEDRQLQGVRLALKTILPHIAAKPDMQERFEREVLLARKVVHPNLCPIYDIFHCEHEGANLTFLTMKLLSGETLSARIKREGAIPLPEAGHIVRQVGAALTAAHDAGILHRDIKTANIMLEGSGEQVRACVTDFGLARAYQSESTVLTAEGVAGTPGYVAPELFHGAPASTASDVYAFGVVVYKMLTGFSPPIPSDSKAGVAADPFLEKLPEEWKRLLERCLEPSAASRSQNIPEALEPLPARVSTKTSFSTVVTRLSRRRLIAIGAGATAAAAGGVWLNWPRIDFALHPLPAKRFVALLDWPTAADPRIAPMVAAVVDAIGNELARAEAFDHNLFIIPHHIGKDITNLAQLNDVRESLGANLVLAASGIPGTKEITILLRVLDVAASKTLREKRIAVSTEQRLSLPEKAVRIAAELLNISNYEPDDQRSKAGTTSTAAYTALQDADASMKQDNDSGLDAAIEGYKKVIGIDPRYAIAYARLAMAYCRLSAIHRDPAAIDLARANCETALSIDSSCVAAHMALASTLDQSGDKRGALAEMKKALAVDPSNVQTLVWQAQIYTHLNRWQDAEDAFERIIRQRPNNWLAHNEFGVLLNAQGKYALALREFRAAALAAPKNTYPPSNIGAVLLQLGKIDEASANCRKSLAIKPNALAAETMAAIFRIDKEYQKALEFAKQAAQLDPDDSTTWLELGDCYSLFPGKQRDANKAYSEALRVQSAELETNPTDGPGLMLRALYQIKLGQTADALGIIQKADEMPAGDIDSQLYKARALELLGRRSEALLTISQCLARGGTIFQIQHMPDMGAVILEKPDQNT